MAAPSNRLALEKSPYLLQHAHNPVDWYPWGDEAFQKAALENKPVMLSIGYSTCHWCHVMERESFEDAESARLLNEYFVPIKVDREERPDIDGVYMSFVMSATGSGGWPMTVFLTPDKKPFFGGTYFPPEDRYGRPGFKTLLHSITNAWRDKKDQILLSAGSSARYLNESSAAQEKAALTPVVFDHAFSYFDAVFDAEHGGFGSAPKFPRSHSLSFLLRYWKRTGSAKALEMTTVTLDAMMDGGIYDQLGGGFHRYSTDDQWRIAHFEKMLYDQALLVRTYTEAYQVTKNPEYARTVRETLDYVLREMTDTDGGFYSAEDADSPDPDAAGEKKEGAFFLWKKEAIESLLPSKAADIFKFYYGIEAAGNALSDPHHEFENKNVLYRARASEETALFFKTTAPEVEKSISGSRKILFAVRGKRPRPYRDDKILADWNGLMIVAFTMAARALGEERYTQAALKAATFILDRLAGPKGRLLHRYREGEAAIDGTLNDYAFMAEACLALYETTFDGRWLEKAKGLAAQMTEFFWDKAGGGFYLTAHDAEALITRPKEVYDGAVPSANSVAALVLLKLERMTAEAVWAARAREVLDAFSMQLSESPSNFTQMLAALDFAIGPFSEVVIAADAKDKASEEFLKEINARFIPNQVLLWNKKQGPEFLKHKVKVDGRPAVYICRGYACQTPITDLEKLKESLDA